MGYRLHQIVAALLVLMHLAVGHAAGSRVCLGEGGCHRVGVVHLGFGHAHEHEGQGADANPAQAADEPHGGYGGGYGHRHDGERHDHVAAIRVSACPDSGEFAGSGDACEGSGCDRGCEPGQCECAEAWVPAVRAGHGSGDDRGDDVVGPLACIALVPVAIELGGVLVFRAARAADQRPPGASLGLRSTVLLI